MLSRRNDLAELTNSLKNEEFIAYLFVLISLLKEQWDR